MKRTTLFVTTVTLLASAAFCEPTPPIMPKVVETPLPQAVEIPAPAQKSADAPQKPVTASQAVEIALRNQPDVSSARAGLNAAGGRKMQVRSGLLPSIGVNSNYNNSNSNSSSSGKNSLGSNGYLAAATLKQLVFDFNHTKDLTKQAQALETSAGVNLDRVNSDVAFGVKQAFYGLVQNERLVVVNESNLKNRQNHLEMAKARLKAGMGLPSDVVRAETAVSEAALNLNLAQTSASISRMNLAELMGIDPRTPIKTADSSEPDIVIDDLNKLVEQALKDRPEVLQAKAKLAAAEHGLNAARTTNMPALSASGGYTGRGSAFPLSEDSLGVNVTVQFSPFDSGYAAGKVQEAGANMQTAESDLDAATLSVTTEVSRAYLNMKTAEQRVRTSDAEVSNAEESVRLSQGRYTSGLGTFLDVLDAQTALLTAQTNRINALASVQQARAALRHAVGEN